MERFFIDIGIDRNGFYPEFLACADNPDGNLAAVCYQNLFEQFHP
jgi:hypothetical protein